MVERNLVNLAKDISKTMQTLDSQTFKTRDAASYDAVTEQFDFFTEHLTSPLAARMISLAEIKQTDSVLDVGTGTGIVALQAYDVSDRAHPQRPSLRRIPHARGLCGRFPTRVD